MQNYSQYGFSATIQTILMHCQRKPSQIGNSCSNPAEPVFRTESRIEAQKVLNSGIGFELTSLLSSFKLEKMETSLPLSQLLSRIPESNDRALLFFREEELRMQVEQLNKAKALERYLFLAFKSKKREVTKKNWSDQEIQYLLYVVDKFCFFQQKSLENLDLSCWETIAGMTPGRVAEECMFKALSLKKYSLSEYPWTTEEDEYFREIIEEKGEKWDIVSRSLYLRANSKVFRNSKVCREHFMCFFNPTIRKGPWSAEEDYHVACCYVKLGRRWSRMAKEIQGRNQNSIKNRFFLLFQTSKNKKIRSTRSIDLRVANFKQTYERQHEIVPKVESPVVIQGTNQQKNQILVKQEEESFQKDNGANFFQYYDNYMNCLEL